MAHLYYYRLSNFWSLSKTNQIDCKRTLNVPVFLLLFYKMHIHYSPNWSCLTVILIFFYIAQYHFLFLSSLSCQIQPVHWRALKAAAMLGRTALSLGVTAHRLSKNVTFYINEVASPVSGSQTPTSEQHRPLMLMLPWMGSRPQAVAKYCEIYFRTGFDVLVVETEVRTMWSCDPDIYIMLNTVSGLSNNRTGLSYVRIEWTVLQILHIIYHLSFLHAEMSFLGYDLSVEAIHSCAQCQQTSTLNRPPCIHLQLQITHALRSVVQRYKVFLLCRLCVTWGQAWGKVSS